MIPEDIKITTQALLIGAGMFALIDAIVLPLLAWRIKPTTFHQSRWALVIVAWVVWFFIWLWAITIFWDSVYHHVFPAWAENWIPPAFSLLMAIVCLGLWALAVRTRHPVISFCLLGGAWGICTHIWALYRGIVTKPPMLQGASPIAALVIAFFEYTFYWCVITLIAALLRQMAGLIKKKEN